MLRVANLDVPQRKAEGLTRMLGLWDVTSITAGNILGSAIFIAAAFVPREVPHPTLVMLLWVIGSVVAIAGALTYAELGTRFPQAGGQYHYLKHAFGPLWASFSAGLRCWRSNRERTPIWAWRSANISARSCRSSRRRM